MSAAGQIVTSVRLRSLRQDYRPTSTASLVLWARPQLYYSDIGQECVLRLITP